MAILVALLPVIAFLLLLILFDSFKLVPSSMIGRALAAGAIAALAASFVHGWILSATGIEPGIFTRYVAPVTEETLKGLFLIYPLWRRQIGFLVDAAIIGFAVGAGFAVVENIEYLRIVPDQRLWTWIVRGFGTAMLHAMTTAVIAISAKSLMDRREERAVARAPPRLDPRRRPAFGLQSRAGVAGAGGRRPDAPAAARGAGRVLAQRGSDA